MKSNLNDKDIIMGLDMYLNAERYISSFDPEDEALKAGVSQLLGFANPVDVETITIQVGYWRKANAIHGWFVKNVQNGEDECNPHSVERSELEELRELCVQVLANPESAADLLPRAEGFFFGAAEYDNYYFDDLRETVEIIDQVLVLPYPQWSFKYQSSW